MPQKGAKGTKERNDYSYFTISFNQKMFCAFCAFLWRLYALQVLTL
jgi:hypothetical protein